MNSRYTYIRFVSVVVFSVALLAGMIFGNIYIVKQLPTRSDFLIQWNSAREWVVESINPYDPQVGQTSQAIASSDESKSPAGQVDYAFHHPLYSMLFFAPLGPVDYPTARAIWMTILEFSLLGIAWFGMKITGLKMRWVGIVFLILFVILGYFGVRGVLTGHFAIIAGLLITLALYLLQKKQDLDAGLLLALSTSILSLSCFVVLYAFVWGIFSRRSRLSLGIVGGISFLVILSLVFLPSWPKIWIGQVLAILQNQQANGSALSAISAAFPGISKPFTLISYSICAIYIILEWLLSFNKTDKYFTWTAYLTLAISFFIIPGVSSAYFLVLVPALFLLFRSWMERWGSPGEQAAWGLLSVLFLTFWGLSVKDVQSYNESVWVILLFPLLVIFSLWWSRWWTLRRPRVLFEEFSN